MIINPQFKDHNHLDFIEAEWKNEKPEWVSSTSDNQWFCGYCGAGVQMNGISIYKCPYGKPGDVIWVRETHYAYGHWTRVITTLPNSVKKEYHFHDLTLSENKVYMYEDCPPETILKRWGLGYHKRPSIFMPKAACRLRLEIIDERPERLQDISEEDAMAEGVYFYGWDDPEQYDYKNYLYDDKGNYDDFGLLTATESYKSLWIKINGKGAWDRNDWVWAITYKML